jgi:Ni,Fe-hydrogenase I cytochrome b subunit
MSGTDRAIRKTPYAHLFRLSHWILAAGMIFLILTGYGVNSVSMPSWSIFGKYPSFYPTFRTIYWHKFIGMVFAPASIIALILFIPKMAGLKISNLRKIVGLFVVGSAVVCAVTSLGLIYTNIPAWLYHFCRFMHAFCGMLIAPIALLTHIYLALFKYFRLLVPSFAPFRQSRWPQALWLFFGLVLSWSIFTRFVSYHSNLSLLTARKVSQSIPDAGQIDRLPWDFARAMDIQLVNGAGFDSGVTRASIQALYSDNYFYMRIRWQDSVYDRMYRPWVKTETGWMHLNPGGSDENIYNEDKFALLFPINKDMDFQRYGCSMYCHNDQKDHRGQHWTPNDRPVDVWHWKATRMDPMGYVDDKYWLGTGAVSPDKEGRKGDPGHEGYATNAVDGVSHPIMLPTGIDAETMGALILSKAEVYTKTAADRLPVGSVIPGALISEANGDRADVRCRSAYENNTWTLQIVRKMDTGSPYDVIFRPGHEYDFTIAAFDHTAHRHAYNHQVYRLYFAP